MTTIVLNYSTSLLEKIWENLKGFGRGLVFARQMQANRDIADHLWRIGEYKTYHEALEVLNRKTLEYMKNV